MNFCFNAPKVTAGRQEYAEFLLVYILVSKVDETVRYTGITRNLQGRLSKHNQGACAYTSKHHPWRVEVVLAFRSESKARAFKKYLKTGSGREFAPIIFDFRSQCTWRGKAVAPTRHAGIEMKAEALAKADVFELGEVLLRATRRAQDQEMAFTYVYILHSERDPRRFYTGCAHDLRDRLNPPQQWQNPLSASGRAFAKRHL